MIYLRNLNIELEGVIEGDLLRRDGPNKAFWSGAWIVLRRTLLSLLTGLQVWDLARSSLWCCWSNSIFPSGSCFTIERIWLLVDNAFIASGSESFHKGIVSSEDLSIPHKWILSCATLTFRFKEDSSDWAKMNDRNWK